MGDFKLTQDPTLPCTAALLRPEWALEERAALDAARHRSVAGVLSTVTWERYGEFRVPLKWVAPDVATLLGRWWREGIPVAFTLDTSHARSTVVCAIANVTAPLGQRTAPQADAWSGILTLTARTPGGRIGQPFILDDVRFGRLDDPMVSLVP